MLLDSPRITKYAVDFVKRVQSHDALELSCVFLIEPDKIGKSSRSPVANLLLNFILAIERIFLLKNRRHNNHLQMFDLSSVLPNTNVHPLNDDDIQPVAAADLDLLVTLSPTAPLHLRNAAKLGVVTISHSIEFINGDGLAGFWEVYFRRDVSSFSVKRFIKTSGTGDLLLRGQVGTQFYFLLNQATLFEKSSYYLFKVVESMASAGEVPTPEPNYPVCCIPRSTPSALEAIYYLIGLVRLATGKLLENARGYKYRWNVGFLLTDWRNAKLCRASIIENPAGRFLADPFALSRNGRNYCFAEDIDCSGNRGKIAAYSLEADRATFLGVALEENFHLSYPYLFQYQGELYMCPETSESRDIRIYKCVDFPLRWKLAKVIMKNVSAVDTMLFERNGVWWMLTNVDPANWSDHSLELCIFSAKSPLDEAWVSHPGNPFFIDALRARNGGMIKEGDKIFRVAQAQGFDTYGKRTTVNQIVELDDQIYVEKCVYEILPSFKRGIVATHHLHSVGDITVLDFARDGHS